MNGGRYHEIRRLARGLVTSAQVPVPVEDIVRAQGIELVFDPFADPHLSGLASRRDGNRVIAVNCANPYSRQRFTISHELGHLVLHDREDIFVDGDVVIGRREESRARSPEEREADLFASELLMPEALIIRDLHFANERPLLSAIQTLAERYGVSELAMSIRLRDYVDLLTQPKRRGEAG
jgi:Zn-dependent peptidase ImmA (M78 family)